MDIDVSTGRERPRTRAPHRAFPNHPTIAWCDMSFHRIGRCLARGTRLRLAAAPLAEALTRHSPPPKRKWGDIPMRGGADLRTIEATVVITGPCQET